MSTWQPIETAPKNGSRIIIAWQLEQGTGEWEQRMAFWDPSHSLQWNKETETNEIIGAWTDDAVESWWYEETKEYHPTHWMPCPTPPVGN